MIYVFVAVVIVVFFVVGLMFFRILQKRNRPSLFLEENYDLKSITIADIDRMEDGSGFEMYLYRLFLELGYSGVYKTVGSRDFGIVE
nr:hypothetical protein [Paenibacillus durus]